MFTSIFIQLTLTLTLIRKVAVIGWARCEYFLTYIMHFKAIWHANYQKLQIQLRYWGKIRSSLEIYKSEDNFILCFCETKMPLYKMTHLKYVSTITIFVKNANSFRHLSMLHGLQAPQLLHNHSPNIACLIMGTYTILSEIIR